VCGSGRSLIAWQPCPYRGCVWLVGALGSCTVPIFSCPALATLDGWVSLF
ncbi:hypothetical protein L208DRAFT_1283448, partial [Tricholoma matsutake]